MGGGIARVAVEAGFAVVLYDVATAALERARRRLEEAWRRHEQEGRVPPGTAAERLGRLQTTTDLGAVAPAAVVIEAAPEDLGLKQDLLASVGRRVRPEALIASNTSSLSITALARVVPGPERVIGLHFFNPVPAMRLVEVVAGALSAPEAVARGVDLARRLGKEPVVCADTPGFVVNRVARPFYGEALRLLGEGAAGVETIDALVRAAGFPMGPFQLMDLIGVDVNLAVTRSVFEGYGGEARYRPHPIQQQLMAAGWLGRKAGRGFYRYGEAGEPVGVAWRGWRQVAAGSGLAGNSPETGPAAAGGQATGAEAIGGQEGLPGRLWVVGDGPLAQALGERWAEAGVEVERIRELREALQRPAGVTGPKTAGIPGAAAAPAPGAAQANPAGPAVTAASTAAATAETPAAPGTPETSAAPETSETSATPATPVPPPAPASAGGPLPAAVVITWEDLDPLAPGFWSQALEDLARLEAGLPPGVLLLVSLLPGPVAEQAWVLVHPQRVVGWAAAPPLGQAVELAAGPTTSPAALARARSWFERAGLAAHPVADGPGGVAARMVAMLIQEAAAAEADGIAEGEAIDRAMRLGTGYPRGLLEWGALWGWRRVLALVEGLWRHYREERYRPLPALRRRALRESKRPGGRASRAPGGTSPGAGRHRVGRRLGEVHRGTGGPW
ncbi:3-hydroxyacyl-CoA dehydrogenase [Thermaerobacter sp. PB12/4term]|nr:3-hydroxyacyl-CoA dehydrogenase [Thermaerobacter sp. PB12/4term]